jgi:hypothetical protein
MPQRIELVWQPVFKDKTKLYEMVNLRVNGWSLQSLAFLYECDWTSIEHQCRKYQIEPAEDVFKITNILRKGIKNPPKRVWAFIDDEVVCLGRTYKDYLKK